MRISALPVASRYFLARHRWVYWTAVAVVVALSTLATLSPLRTASSAREAWGTRVPVMVALEPIPIGSTLDTRVETRLYPIAVVPTDAITNLAPAAVARRSLATGQILTRADLAATGLASRARPGEVVITIIESVASGAALGDRVMVTSDGITLADDALVIDRAEGGRSDALVRLSVPRQLAPVIAAAASPTLVLVP